MWGGGHIKRFILRDSTLAQCPEDVAPKSAALIPWATLPPGAGGSVVCSVNKVVSLQGGCHGNRFSLQRSELAVGSSTRRECARVSRRPDAKGKRDEGSSNKCAF